MKQDPVCGMLVDEEKAAHEDYQGTTYSFCSPSCQERFRKDPKRYAGPAKGG